MEKNKLVLSISILLGCIIVGGFIYAVQVNKQRSIEGQQLLERQDERTQKDLENKRAELKLKQDECESLSDGVRKRWNNIIGVTYDSEFWKDCIVTYTDTKTGEVQTSPLKFMQDTR
ncbi:MAG: hypothetical protein WCW02_04145 [Candidatus Buchananbacteria bacterium]